MKKIIQNLTKNSPRFFTNLFSSYLEHVILVITLNSGIPILPIRSGPLEHSRSPAGLSESGVEVGVQIELVGQGGGGSSGGVSRVGDLLVGALVLLGTQAG